MAGVSGRVLLESSGSDDGFSFLAADPVLLMRSRGGRTTIVDREAGEEYRFSDPFAALTQLIRAGALPRSVPGAPAFAGGLVGFLGYECGDFLERLPTPPPDDLGVPDAWFGLYDAAIVWQHSERSVWAVAAPLSGRAPSGAAGRFERLLDALSKPGEDRRPPAGPVSAGQPEFLSSLSRAAFEGRVERLIEYIRAGDIFQANLTRRLSVATSLSGVELYVRLVKESPSSHGAYLDCGEMEIASISPERYLSVRGSRVRTDPIKGTRRRGRDQVEDRALAAELGSSEKDRAENVMIVDLLRNDLSRVCLPGSVSVPRLAEVEVHPTVHHLVSTVTGVLAPDLGVADLLRATFPGGSVTGAPKIRAMELIRELEPVRRGVYTGALGILARHGDAELSVAIRTAILTGGWSHYGTGGGITLRSSPPDEWAETEDKAAAFLRAMRPPTQ